MTMKSYLFLTTAFVAPPLLGMDAGSSSHRRTGGRLRPLVWKIGLTFRTNSQESEQLRNNLKGCIFLLLKIISLNNSQLHSPVHYPSRLPETEV